MWERVTINISGTKFETSRDIFSQMISRECLAVNELERSQTKEDETLMEYTLERGVGSFQAILGFYQGRGLHIPSSVCIMEFKDELEFWGIQPSEMCRSCYCKYMSFFDDQSALEILEMDQERRFLQRMDVAMKARDETGWRRLQAKTWLILEDPTYSILGRVCQFVYNGVHISCRMHQGSIF